MNAATAIGIVALLALALGVSAVRIAREYERGVVFRLGRLISPRGPGLYYMEATSQIAQTTLRAVLGQSSLDELLGARDKINDKLRAIIDRQTEPWGIKVGTVELKDAQLAESMVRALARQAEAEREKRAKIIATEGEFQAAQVLANAAQIISTQPAALALRYIRSS
jgi:regulator of protease activity HflC (stomatin/prohibitin superfamily)